MATTPKKKSTRNGAAASGKRIVLIGAGRMGLAMARGWLADMKAAGLSGIDLIDLYPSEDALALAKKKSVRLNPEAPERADIVVLAVKPQVFEEAAEGIAPWIGASTLVVSVMAGITLQQMARTLDHGRCVRSMPNTPGAVGKGITVFSVSEDCKASDSSVVRKLLAPLGEVEGPVAEDLMDAVTAISGSGPAYAFLLAETMAAAGRKLGLSETLAVKLAQTTVSGAGALLEQPDARADDLRRAVTSPNGTTQAALDVLMKPGGLPDLMRVAAEAAANRAAELSRGE